MDTFVFSSRRSPVISLNGCVASSQPLATNTGLDILKRGGNAADAAVAVAAALAVTEPGSTGLGGDAFCLFYNGRTGDIKGLNGSGRSAKAQSLDYMESRGFSTEAPPSAFDALNVTVPGAPACWCDAIQRFGSHKLSLQEVLRGAVELAEVGFPVAEVTAHHWALGVSGHRDAGKHLGPDLLIDGHAPKRGQVFRNLALAQTLRELGECGKAAFYEGRVAAAIVDVIRENGGVMTLEDLKSHNSEVISPIGTRYKGVTLWEPPPNGQGLAALLLLNILDNFPLKDMDHNSSDYIHILAEALRLAQTDVLRYLGDPDHVTVPIEVLLEKSYGRTRAQSISLDRVMEGVRPGLETGSDTVYFCVIDGEGNACSFVNSIYMGFGSGLVPKDCGFPLQMLIPAVVFITLGKCSCCWNESLMMCGSVLAAVVGLLGSSYCFVVSGFTLGQGPQCFTSNGWLYPFSDQGGRYLLQPETWSQCLQPLNIVEWNVTLLCVLLGLAVLEFIICLCQLGNGLVNAICRPCCYKQEYSLNA